MLSPKWTLCDPPHGPVAPWPKPFIAMSSYFLFLVYNIPPSFLLPPHSRSGKEAVPFDSMGTLVIVRGAHAPLHAERECPRVCSACSTCSTCSICKPCFPAFFQVSPFPASCFPLVSLHFFPVHHQRAAGRPAPPPLLASRKWNGTYVAPTAGPCGCWCAPCGWRGCGCIYATPDGETESALAC